jgi:hypothetical protein
MEASGSNVPKCDEEEKALKGLLDAFSSTFSLDEIASAYCKAGRNADLAAEVLFDMQGSTPASATYASNGEAKGEESTESSSGNFSEKLGQASGNSRASKPKSRSVSGGTVSCIIGKEYIRSTPSANGSCKVSKPIRKVWRVASMSELSEVEVKPGSPKDDPMHQDMDVLAAEVLFDMQGSTPASATYASNGEAKGEESTESSSGNFSEKLGQASGNSRASKPKSRSVSGGTVSCIIGKEYIRSTPSANGSCKVSKPIRKVWRVASMSELSEVEVKPGSPKDDPMHQDMDVLAAEVLFDMQGSTSTSATCVSNGDAKGEKSLESSCGNFSEKLGQACGNSRTSKPKSRSVSGGTVSSILGKDYIRSTPSANGSCKESKPIRKVWRVVPMSELSEVEAKSGSPKDGPMRQDMADFLFRMLGDGFKLDRDLILQVLGKPFITSNYTEVNLID